MNIEEKTMLAHEWRYNDNGKALCAKPKKECE